MVVSLLYLSRVLLQFRVVGEKLLIRMIGGAPQAHFLQDSLQARFAARRSLHRWSLQESDASPMRGDEHGRHRNRRSDRFQSANAQPGPPAADAGQKASSRPPARTTAAKRHLFVDVIIPDVIVVDVIIIKDQASVQRSEQRSPRHRCPALAPAAISG
jgi:hypothetical protein